MHRQLQSDREGPNQEQSDEDPDDRVRDRPQRGLEGVRAGDTVIYESRLQAEYRFEVADVDSEWITFETGQKVHADRFRREAFEVSRSRGGETAGLADERDSGQGAAGAADRSTSGAD